MIDSIGQAHAVFVDDAARDALDKDPPGAREERRWSRANPEGRVLSSDDGSLVLWNYDVGAAELKPSHRAALSGYADTYRLAVAGGGRIAIEGHASATGAEAANLQLSRQRAEIVAFVLAAERIYSRVTIS